MNVYEWVCSYHGIVHRTDRSSFFVHFEWHKTRASKKARQETIRTLLHSPPDPSSLPLCSLFCFPLCLCLCLSPLPSFVVKNSYIHPFVKPHHLHCCTEVCWSSPASYTVTRKSLRGRQINSAKLHITVATREREGESGRRHMFAFFLSVRALRMALGIRSIPFGIEPLANLFLDMVLLPSSYCLTSTLMLSSPKRPTIVTSLSRSFSSLPLSLLFSPLFPLPFHLRPCLVYSYHAQVVKHNLTAENYFAA